MAASDTSLRAEVIALGHHWVTAQRRLVRLVVELDSSGEWRADGSPTCAHWVADAIDIEVCTAREWLRVGRTVGALPAIVNAVLNALAPLGVTHIEMPTTSQRIWQAIRKSRAA